MKNKRPVVAKPRRKWALNPKTRVVESRKRYSRKADKVRLVNGLADKEEDGETKIRNT